jgi:hypothetical protein
MWHETLSGWVAAREGYARQQAAKQAALPPPFEAHGPPAPQPRGYDGVINGLWDGKPKLILPKSAPTSAPPPSVPAHSGDWRRYVEPDGSIRSTPRGRFP